MNPLYEKPDPTPLYKGGVPLRPGLEPEPDKRAGAIRFWLALAVGALLAGLALAALLAGCGGGSGPAPLPCPPLCLTPRPTPTIAADSSPTAVHASPTPERTSTSTPTRPPTATQPPVSATPTKPPIDPSPITWTWTKERSWGRKSILGQRMELSTATGSLVVLYPRQVVAKRWQAVAEDAKGRNLATIDYEVSIPRFHQPRMVGGDILNRHKDSLRLGVLEIAPGAFESYAGVPGSVLAWEPCRNRPCPSAVMWEPSGEPWRSAPWAVEAFGFSMLERGSVTAVATREQPNSGGWTLRYLDASALQRGVVQEVAKWTWKPLPGWSLEDPEFVQGPSDPVLVAGASKKAGSEWPTTGHVFIGELGKEPRDVFAGAARDANRNPGAAVVDRLYLLVETGTEESALYGRKGAGFEVVMRFQGGWPALALDGAGGMYVATTAGLWRGTGTR